MIAADFDIIANESLMVLLFNPKDIIL